MTAKKIYLGSRSPRRVALLAQIGIDCIVLPADIDETEHAGESPANYVRRLAKEKAMTCAQINQNQQQLPILTADTTVALGNKILGKPLDDADAFAMLKCLSGTVHEVHTAVALLTQDALETRISTTLVEIMPLTDAQIALYIANGEHSDKAGSYGIQGMAGAWVKRIEGSYTGVMGLPLYETAQLLRKNGILAL